MTVARRYTSIAQTSPLGEASIGGERALPTEHSRQAFADGSVNLLRRFHVISLAITVAATGIVLFAMGVMVEQYLLGKVVAEAGDRFERAVRPALRIVGDAISDRADLLAALDDRVHDRVLGPPIERVALWDTTGRMLYESRPAPFDTPPGRADGTEIPSPSYRVDAVSNGRRLRAFHPIVQDGRLLGFFEAEEDFEPLSELAI